MYYQANAVESLSARRAWIEMPKIGLMLALSPVALRKESVDRNQWIKAQHPGCRVALRKESVDRNLTWHFISEDVSVALRKESVDRNHKRGCII